MPLLLLNVKDHILAPLHLQVFCCQLNIALMYVRTGTISPSDVLLLPVVVLYVRTATSSSSDVLLLPAVGNEECEKLANVCYWHD